jgi:RNA polymerase sigma factor (sigma-70 family)
MHVASFPLRVTGPGPLGSRRVLRLAGDERLVEQIRSGNEAAFEVVFERHAPALLAFCRHMLDSPDEAEDAVQHTFGAAYRDLERDREREIALKPWLFTIARNRCVSMLRSRSEQRPVLSEPATSGLAEQVEQRAELRQLLTDLRELPVEQRCALLLAELGDLSHTDVAKVLGCEVQRVKALVYRARSRLIARRDARETPCTQIRQQLASLRGGSLRRTQLREHLADCSGCRDYRQQVKAQRRMLAAALPIAPSLKLKTSVLAAAGISVGAAGGGAAGALTGFAGALLGGLGSATVAKVAVVGVIAGAAVAGGGVVASNTAFRSRHGPPAVAPATATPLPGDHAGSSRTGTGHVTSHEHQRRATAPRALPPDPSRARTNQEPGPRTPLEDKKGGGRGKRAVSSTPAHKLAEQGRTHQRSAPNHATPKPTGARPKPKPEKAAPKSARPVPKPQKQPKPQKPQKTAPQPKAPATAPAPSTTPSPHSPTVRAQRARSGEPRGPVPRAEATDP